MGEFERAGFDVGPLLANNFSITAVPRRFETYFNVTVEASRLQVMKGLLVRTNKGSVRSHVPLDSLPPSERDQIEAIVFSKPPDFGPGGNY